MLTFIDRCLINEVSFISLANLFTNFVAVDDTRNRFSNFEKALNLNGCQYSVLKLLPEHFPLVNARKMRFSMCS